MKETILQRRATPVARKECPKSEPLVKFVIAAEVIITRRTLRFQWLLPQNTDPEIQGLDKLVSKLLSTYKDFYNGRLLQESWSEGNCLGAFQAIAQEVLNSEDEQDDDQQKRCNWSRIAMLLALACRMAQHLHKNGATAGFVRSFSRAVGMCLADNVTSCGNQQDTWSSLRPRNSNKLDLFGVGAMVVGAVWTVATLTQPSTFWLNQLKQ